jgi:hypothetical protein
MPGKGVAVRPGKDSDGGGRCNGAKVAPWCDLTHIWAITLSRFSEERIAPKPDICGGEHGE